MVNKELVKFIEEARRRGFDDYKIKEALMSNGWQVYEIDEAFASIKPKFKFRNKVCIYLDSDVLHVIEKRAKKNLFTISEQIEDILRRSAISTQKITKQNEKLDDMLVSIFSRKKYKRKQL